MGQLSPFLKLLLGRKRSEIISPIGNDLPEQGGISPTIPMRSRGRLAGVRIPFLPTIPGVFNDGDVEEAKRNIRPLPRRDGMYPPQDPNASPIDPGMYPPPSRFPDPSRGLSQGLAQEPTQQPTIPLMGRGPMRSVQSLDSRQTPMTDETLDDNSRRERIIDAMQKSTNLSPEGKDNIEAVNSVWDEGKARESAAPISLRPRPSSVNTSAFEQSPPSNIAPIASESTIALKPRSRVDEAAETVRKYDQGLHPDPKTGQWVPHKRNKALQILEGLGNYAASGVGLDLQGLLHPRGTPEQQARGAYKNEVGMETVSLNRRKVESEVYKAPQGSTRIIGEGEYPGVPAGTEIRQRWDSNTQDYVDDLGRDGHPRVSKAPPADRAAAKEIKYNSKGQAMLVPKDGGAATLIFQEDGTPLTKQANESGNVQTAYRLDRDGITQIQIERDGDTGEWIDSVGRDKKPVVRGTVGRIDPVTGAPIAALITDSRLTTKERQENERKRKSYEGEATEWGVKETTFRQNKTAEDTAIRTKTAQLQTLHNEQPRGYGGLTGGTRSRREIDVDKARLQKEIETHRTNATHFQNEADKAASAATQARRNAGLNTTGTQGVMGRSPARDGKYHYTAAEIRAQAEAAGVSYEELSRELRKDKNVKIDE